MFQQSSDVPEMRTFLSDQLWCIAEDTLGVDRPTAAGGGLNWSRVRTNTAEATGMQSISHKISIKRSKKSCK